MSFGVIVQAHTLTEPGLSYVSCTEEAMQIARDCGVDDWQDVSAAFVMAEDGDYSKAWISYSSTPYYANANYIRVR